MVLLGTHGGFPFGRFEKHVWKPRALSIHTLMCFVRCVLLIVAVLALAGCGTSGSAPPPLNGDSRVSTGVAPAATVGLDRSIAPAPAFAGAQLAVDPTDGWPTNGGSVSNERFGALSQINRENVSRLRGVWRVHLGSAVGHRYSNEVTPIVLDGVIYISTGANDVFAIDVATGKQLWEHRSTRKKDIFNCCGSANRGVAVGDGRVYMGQLDGSVVALDQRTGKPLWRTEIESWKRGYIVSAAPLYVDGMVISGVSGGEYGGRGRVVALDAKTGRERWHFFTIKRPGQVPRMPYTDRSEYWAAEQAALGAYLRWSADHAGRLGTEDALSRAAETATASSRTARIARLLGLEPVPEWTHLQHLAERVRAVVEQWEREDGRSTPGNWEVFTGLRDHASRYRSTAQDRNSHAYRTWARSPEPLTLDDDTTEFIPGILPWEQYTVTGPQGLESGQVDGRDLAAGLAQLTADGMDVEETEAGLVVSGPGATRFSIQPTTAEPRIRRSSIADSAAPAAEPSPDTDMSPEPDRTTDPETEAESVPDQHAPRVALDGATYNGVSSVLPQVENLAILLEGYADAAELVGGRRLVASAAERLQQAIARHLDDDPSRTAAHQDAAAAAAAVTASQQRPSAHVFPLYDHLAEAAEQLVENAHDEVITAAHRTVRYTERHLARLQALKNDLDDVLSDASDMPEDAHAVLNHSDPLRLTAPWYTSRTELIDALHFIRDSFQKWPHAYDSQGGEYSDQLRGAMLLLHRPHDTVGSALTDWMQVTSYALGAAQEAQDAGDGVSRYTLRDVARRAFRHHQRLAAHQPPMDDVRPYTSARDFVGAANRAESAWHRWLATSTAKVLLDRSREELREMKLLSARDTLDAARTARLAADWATVVDGTLDQVSQYVTAMAHAAYDLVLSLDPSDFQHPDDAKALFDLVRCSYGHAAGCQASTAWPETTAAARAGVVERQERLAAEREPEPAAGAVAGARTTAPPDYTALEIEHHFRGTVVRGTTKGAADAPVREALQRLKFKWSGKQNFWYLRRNMAKATRDVRVQRLTDELSRLNRPYRMVEEPQQPTAPHIVIPVGEPYATKEDAEHDFQDMFGGLWNMRETPAGRRLVTRGMTDQGVPARPDGQAVWLAMEELRGGAVGSSLDPFAHPAKDVVERCTKLAHAVLVLARNLEEERYRAPVALRHFQTMKRHAVQLASRITATAQQRSHWQEIFGTPALPSEPIPAELHGTTEEAAPEENDHRQSDTLQIENNADPTDAEGVTADDAGQAAHGPHEEQQLRIEITVAARDAAGHLLVNVALPAARTGDVHKVPELRIADVPGLALPAHAAFPQLVRPANRAESLVSDEEVDAWLGEHLPDSPLGPAWNAPALRTVIQRTVRDVLRDSMAPAPEDVAAWLVTTASENQALIRSAHSNDQDDFLAVFTSAADELITDGGSEHLLWTYLKEDGRREVLGLAGPRAHRELRQQALEQAQKEAGSFRPGEPTTSPASESAREVAEAEADSAHEPAEIPDQAWENAVRAALADDRLLELLRDGRPREAARELFTEWLSTTAVSTNTREGETFRRWFHRAPEVIREQYAELVFEQVYTAALVAPADRSAEAGEVRQLGATPSGPSELSAASAAPRAATPLSPELPSSEAGPSGPLPQVVSDASRGMSTGSRLTEEHLHALPRGPQRRPNDDVRIAVLANLPFRDGQVQDALLLLQNMEDDEYLSDDPLVYGAQVVPANKHVSSSANARWTPKQLLPLPGSRVLHLARPIPWEEVETLVGLPYEQVLQQLPLAQAPPDGAPDNTRLMPANSRVAEAAPP